MADRSSYNCCRDPLDILRLLTFRPQRWPRWFKRLCWDLPVAIGDPPAADHGWHPETGRWNHHMGLDPQASCSSIHHLPPLTSPPANSPVKPASSTPATCRSNRQLVAFDIQHVECYKLPVTSTCCLWPFDIFLWHVERNFINIHNTSPMFGRATITLGIDPHSSCYYYTIAFSKDLMPSFSDLELGHFKVIQGQCS